MILTDSGSEITPHRRSASGCLPAYLLAGGVAEMISFDGIFRFGVDVLVTRTINGVG